LYPLRAKYAPLPIGAAILAALQGGQDGEHPPTIRAQSSANPDTVRSTYESATSPSNERGS